MRVFWLINDMGHDPLFDYGHLENNFYSHPVLHNVLKLT